MLALAAPGALAQSSADINHLQDRVERLEAQLRLHGGAGGPPDGDPTSAASLSMRISQVEEQMRHLNGQIEQMAHTIRQLERQFGHAPSVSEADSQFPGGGGWQVDTEAAQGLDRLPEQGQGEPPRILGQVPGQPLDLSDTLDLPGGFGEGSEGGSGDADQFAALPVSGEPRRDYDTAYGYILRGEFAAAEQGFQQFLEHYPEDELAGNAQFWLGESLFARARYRDAADAYLVGYTEYPDGAKAPDSLFKLGLSLKELGQREAACATLTEIDRRYPNAPQVVRERAHSELDKSGC